MTIAKLRKLFMTAGGFALALTLAAPASNAASGTTTAKKDEVIPSWTDNVRLSYSGEFEGPAIGNFTSRKPTARGEQGDPIDLYNSLSLGYMVGGGYKVYAQGRAQLNAEGSNTLQGLNPRLGISKGDIIKIGDFSVFANLTNQFSVFSGDYWLAPGSVTVTSLPLGRFTLGTTTDLRAFFFRGPVGTGKTDLAMYLSPYVNYKLSPTFTASLWYEMAAVHKGGQGLTLDDDGTALSLGLSWDLSEKFNLTPYLRMYTGDVVSLESTQFLMQISATIL
jgi:hypothetical protein